MAQSRYSYCSPTTCSFCPSNKFPTGLIDYNELIIREGYMGNPVFANGENAIDFDAIESFLALQQGRDKAMSMDSGFCVDNESSKQLVLAELKFNSTSFYGLTKTKLEGKIAGTTAAINGAIQIHGSYYIVVKVELLNEAYHRINRMIPRLNNQFTPISIEGLKEMFF